MDDDFDNDVFQKGHVDQAVFQSTYLKDWYTEGFNTAAVNGALAANTTCLVYMKAGTNGSTAFRRNKWQGIEITQRRTGKRSGIASMLASCDPSSSASSA